jgi:hypothetical protein
MTMQFSFSFVFKYKLLAAICCDNPQRMEKKPFLLRAAADGPHFAEHYGAPNVIPARRSGISSTVPMHAASSMSQSATAAFAFASFIFLSSFVNRTA